MFSSAALYCGVHMRCLEIWPPAYRHEESKTNKLRMGEEKDGRKNFVFADVTELLNLELSFFRISHYMS